MGGCEKQFHEEVLGVVTSVAISLFYMDRNGTACTLIQQKLFFCLKK